MTWGQWGRRRGESAQWVRGADEVARPPCRIAVPVVQSARSTEQHALAAPGGYFIHVRDAIIPSRTAPGGVARAPASRLEGNGARTSPACAIRLAVRGGAARVCARMARRTPARRRYPRSRAA